MFAGGLCTHLEKAPAVDSVDMLAGLGGHEKALGPGRRRHIANRVGDFHDVGDAVGALDIVSNGGDESVRVEVQPPIRSPPVTLNYRGRVRSGRVWED